MKRFAIAMLSASLALPALAEEIPNWREETLTGDWNGARTALYERGLHFDGDYKADFVRNASGGLATGNRFMGLLELKLKIDGEPLAGWSGTTAYVHVISNLGGQANTALVGSFMGVDNIEVLANSVKFLHAWVEKTFWDDKASALFGVYPIDSEFYITDTSGVFLHPSFGMGAEVASSGSHGPAVFPNGALGVRLKLRPEPRFYAQFAVTDGVPGDPNNPRGTHLRMGSDDGFMTVAEFGYLPFEAGHLDEPNLPEKGLPLPPEEKAHERAELTGKVALGIWFFAPRLDDLFDVDPESGTPQRHYAHGAYLLAERSLYVEPGQSSQGLAGFARYGFTDAKVSPLAYSWSLGLTYTGLLPGRDDDVLGFAATLARASEQFREANAPLETTETAFELTYRAKLVPWLTLQPTLQRIVNPGFDPALGDAWVGLLRAEITF